MGEMVMKKIFILTVCLTLLACAAAMADTLMLPQNLTRIEDKAFYGDGSLDRVQTPQNIQSIGSKAFAYSSLKEILYPAGRGVVIADDAFEGVKGIRIDTTEGGVTTISWKNLSIKETMFKLISSGSEQTCQIEAEALGTISYQSKSEGLTVSETGLVTVAADFVGTGTILVSAPAAEGFGAVTVPVSIVAKKKNVLALGQDTLTTAGSPEAHTVTIEAAALTKLGYASGTEGLTVDEKGVVTIAGGFVGTGEITVTAAEDETHWSAEEKVTITVSQIESDLTGPETECVVWTSGAERTYAVPASATGALSYESGDSRITVSDDGEVRIPEGYTGGITITVRAAETALYLPGQMDIVLKVKKIPDLWGTITYGSYLQTATYEDGTTVDWVDKESPVWSDDKNVPVQWNKTPIEWIVLDIDEENQRALVISKYGLEPMAYNRYTKSVTWETCTLRTWLNGDFLSTAFTSEEQTQILTTTVDNSQSQCYAGWSTKGGNDTEDQVFLLSCAEANYYFGVAYEDRTNVKARVRPTDYALHYYYQSSALMIDSNSDISPQVDEEIYGTSKYKLYAGSWWLRSPGRSRNYAASVGFSGNLVEGYETMDYVCVRPVFWLNLK